MNILARPVRTQKPTSSKRVRRLTDPFIDDIVRDYRHGLSVYALASKYGAHRGVIAKHLKTRGVEFRPTVLSSEVAKALALHEQGHSPNRIGQLLGRDPKTIRSLLRRHGLQV